MGKTKRIFLLKNVKTSKHVKLPSIIFVLSNDISETH